MAVLNQLCPVIEALLEITIFIVIQLEYFLLETKFLNVDSIFMIW